MQIFTNGALPDEIPEGFDYYIFVADRPDGARLYGVFIGDAPDRVHDIDVVKGCPPGTMVAVSLVTREDYEKFVIESLKSVKENSHVDDPPSAG